MTFVDRIGMTLLHFVWEGTLICAIYACIRKMVGCACRPNVRYVLACAALGTLVCAPFLTFFLLFSPVSVDSSAPSGLVHLAPTDTLTLHGFAFALLAPVQEHHGNLLPWVVTVWFAGVFVLSVRLARAWLVAERTLSAHIRRHPQIGRRHCLSSDTRLVLRGASD